MSPSAAPLSPSPATHGSSRWFQSTLRRASAHRWVPLLVVGALVRCRADSSGPNEGAEPGTSAALDVFAAASLHDAFIALEAPFRSAHPEAVVRFHFAGTQQLRTQIEHGAGADVFVSADIRHIDELARAGAVEPGVVFARNEMALVVSPEAVERVHSLADLPALDRLVIAATQVPAGGYALQVLDRAEAVYGDDFRERVEARVVSRELNVRRVLSRVQLGEADAGLVYRTDAIAANGVSLVEIDPEMNAVAEYSIAIVRGAREQGLAEEWSALLRSPDGQEMLSRFGFVRIDGTARTP